MVNPRSPRAWARSDRSGMLGNHENLRWQFQWAGTRLVNQNILVWPDELDVPQRQLGALILPPDPMPIMNARPEQEQLIDEIVYRLQQDGTQRLQMDGTQRIESNKQS